MKNKPTNHHRNFKGSIDDLLKHANQIDADVVEHELTNDVPLSDEEHIDTIMADCNCSKEEAAEILQEMKEFQVTEVLEDLLEKGLIEITSYDPDGEPRYGQTEFGKQVAEAAKKEYGDE